MYDMNFFAPFQGGRKPKHKGSWIKVVIILLFIILIAAPSTYYILISKLNNDIEDIQGVLRLPKNEALIKELEAKTNLVATAEAAYNALLEKEKMINTEDWFSEELLRIVVDSMPKQVRLTGMSLTQTEPSEEGGSIRNGFNITGVAADKPAVAEMEYNLRNTGLFLDIFVFTIVDEEGTLQFDLQFSVKDGAKP